ncbi:MAG: hydroxymethylbilane synthase [Chloroflexi bacterium]|nr:hydroxymethylbilane synthase [Chloroflexota bacterium]
MTTTDTLRIGTRTSPLSLAQTDEVVAQLRAAAPDLRIEVVPMNTEGDRNKIAPLLSMERGMFVKALEVALLSNEVDLAVHSAKDLPSELPDGLTIGAITRREDPRDVIVNKWGLPLEELPEGARIGTSSPRRIAQLKRVRPDISFIPIRGNVGTRLEKAQGSDYDGVVLAAAGIVRLGRQSEISQYLTPEVCVPDVGQGALALEIRADDEATRSLVAIAGHPHSSLAVRAERAFLKAMGGGCTVPVAAYAVIENGRIVMSAVAATPDGSTMVKDSESFAESDPEGAGEKMASTLLSMGAREILAAGVS